MTSVSKLEGNNILSFLWSLWIILIEKYKQQNYLNMGQVFCKRGLKPHQLDQAVLPFHSNWQTRAAWLQWRPMVASQWMNVVTSFRGHLGQLHRNHCIMLNSQKSWMFSQMPPAVEMAATLLLLEIHRRCSLAYSPRLLLWQTFFQGADDITQIREKTHQSYI